MNELAPMMDQSAVWRLQAEIAKMPQVEPHTFHYFADGMYARVVPREKDTLLVGKVHKREHFYIVVMGSVAVLTETGPHIYEAGSILISPPGTKRAVLALEDSVCMTVHRTDKRELEDIEEELIEPDPTTLFDARNQLIKERLT